MSEERATEPVRAFFDEAAARYDDDIQEIGWDPLELVDRLDADLLERRPLLDAACGTGRLLEAAAARCAASGAQSGRLAGFDLSPEMVTRAEERLRGSPFSVSVGDLERPWPVHPGAYDVVLVLGALEFVRDLSDPLRRAARALRPGGALLFTVDDREDWEGRTHPRHDLRYGTLPMWRRGREEVASSIPGALELERIERAQAYRVFEYGFTTAYWLVRARRVR